MTGRWDALLADLSGELEALDRADDDAEIRERTLIEQARVSLADRLRASAGAELSVTVAGAGSLHGTLAEAGTDWLLLATPAGQALVPLAGVLAVTGLATHAAAPPRGAGRLPLRALLAGLARERAPVSAVAGDERYEGVVTRAGADHIDLAGVRVVTLPVAALRVVWDRR